MQEGRDINLTEILLLNSLPCERVIDIEWYSINGSRFAHCNSCQLCTITSDRNHPVPGFWNRLQVTSGSLLLTGIQYNDNGLKLRVTAHLKIASDSDKPLVFRIWIFVDSGRDSSGNCHFTAVYSMTWPLNGSEAGGDLALIQTPLCLSCKCKLVSFRTI